jgi:hypothetical protein
MQKFRAFILLLALSSSVAAQTDAQLDQIRTEVRTSGIESLLAQMAKQMLAGVRIQNTSEVFEILDVAAKGPVMTTTWRVKNVELKDIDRAIELQSKNHTLRTVCNQKIRGMLVKDFGATMLSRYVDKNNKFMWEVRVDKENCNQLQAIEALNTCNMIAIEAMKIMTRETQKTRRSYSDCEVGDKGKISMVLKADWKREPGKSFDDQKVELMGSDSLISQIVCNSPMKKILSDLNYDYRVETHFDGSFITANTLSIESCNSISSDQAPPDPKSLNPQDMKRIKTLAAIEKLGIERYTRTMIEAINGRAGQEVSPNVNIQSASVANNNLVYEYKVLVDKERIDLSKMEDLRVKERAATCNEQTMKILISLFNVSFTKRYSDIKGEFLVESVSSREECRRVWRQ